MKLTGEALRLTFEMITTPSLRATRSPSRRSYRIVRVARLSIKVAERPVYL